MTIKDLHTAHARSAAVLARHREFVSGGNPNQKHDQLIQSTRHLLCCFILEDATEEQLMKISDIARHH